jgi:hypothetical protein
VQGQLFPSSNTRKTEKPKIQAVILKEKKGWLWYGCSRLPLIQLLTWAGKECLVTPRVRHQRTLGTLQVSVCQKELKSKAIFIYLVLVEVFVW